MAATIAERGILGPLVVQAARAASPACRAGMAAAAGAEERKNGEQAGWASAHASP